jgi:phage antirepressor YoqD-like protein
MKVIQLMPGDSYETFESVEGLYTIEEAAKLSQSTIGKAKLYQLLRKKGMVFGNPARPYQKYIDRGYMVVIPTYSDVNGRRKRGHNQIFLTGKGLTSVLNLIHNNYVENEVLDA